MIIPAANPAPAMTCKSECFFMITLAHATNPTIKNNHSQLHPNRKLKKITAADDTPVWIEIFQTNVIRVKTTANIRNISRIFANIIFPNNQAIITPIEWHTKVNPYNLILCFLFVVSQSETSFVDRRCTKYINGINPSIKSNMSIKRHLKPLNKLQPAAKANIPGISHTGSNRREMKIAIVFFTTSQYYITGTKLPVADWQ